MHPTKASGSDRLPATFSQKSWDIVGLDVINLIQHIPELGSFPDKINHTQLILTLKKSACDYPSRFSLIGLCDVLYKTRLPLGTVGKSSGEADGGEGESVGFA